MLEMCPHTTLKLHLDLGWGEPEINVRIQASVDTGMRFIPAIDECQVHFIQLLLTFVYCTHAELEIG